MRRFFGILLVFASAAAWADALPSARPEDVGLSSERLGRIGKARSISGNASIPETASMARRSWLSTAPQLWFCRAGLPWSIPTKT